MMTVTEACKQANWIWLGAVEPNAYAGFVRTVELDGPPAKARIGIFADTHYKLYVNGRFVNAGPAPFRKPVVMIDDYEVASFLKPGRNIIFVLTRYIGETVKYNTVGQPGLVAALSVTTATGREMSVVTDDSWRGFPVTAWARETPKMTWALGGLESVDLNAESFRLLAHFASEDYQGGGLTCDEAFVASRLQPVSCRKEAGLDVRPRSVPVLRWSSEKPLRVLHVFKMTPEIYSLRDNAVRLDSEYREPAYAADEYAMLKAGTVKLNRRKGEKGLGVLYDFMRMTTGDFTITIQSPGNATVDVAFAEHLRAGRPVISRNGSNYYTRLQLSAGLNRFRLFNSNGYQYLLVVLKDFEGDLEILDLVAYESRADLDYQDRLTVPDRTVMSIYDISRRSIMLNVQAEPYDCNTRERGTYWGDSLWVLESVGHMTGNFSQMRRLCDAMTDEYAVTGMLNGSLYGMGEPLYDYSLVPVEMLKRYYCYTADTGAVRAHLGTCEKIIADFRRLKNKAGLIMLGTYPAGGTRHGLLFLDHPGLGWHPRTTTGVEREDCSAGINLFYLQALQALDCLYSVETKGQSLQDEITQLSAAIRTTFLMADKGLLSDCRNEAHGYVGCSQIVNALAVTTGVLSGAEAARAMVEVVDIERNPWIAQGSPYSYFFLADALSRLGMPDLCVRTIKQYWTPMLERGATTTWEAFGGEHHDSFNHAWSAPLPYLVFRGLMGLTPLLPGYQKIALAPFCAAFDQFSATCCIPGGTVHVEWKREGTSTVRLEVNSPGAIVSVLSVGGKTIEFKGHYEGTFDL
jgi:alpha-L-rhamnosidase